MVVYGNIRILAGKMRNNFLLWKLEICIREGTLKIAVGIIQRKEIIEGQYRK